ncbi:hypothetical protein [Sulfitobacter pontiacus]|uniref:hypothetical protein n=1 Tax=Sulfitobacter pontiacus TaxID=60137 RepID=UPI0030ECE8BA
MPGDPSDSSIEVLQWAVTILTAIGLYLQHNWSKRSLVTHREQDQYDKHIADPSRSIIEKIDTFAAAVPHLKIGDAPSETLLISHAIIVKNINSFVTDSVNSPVGGGNDWFCISTKEIESGLPNDTSEKITALQLKSLIGGLERLKGLVKQTVNSHRPN